VKKILVIGAGSIGERHMRCFQMQEGVRVAACEPNEAQGQAVAGRLGCRWFRSLDEALAAESFDAAVVCAPANIHIPLARQCVEADLSVLIEKPLAVSEEGLEAFRDLVESKGSVARVAYVLRFLPVFQKAKALIEDGVLGDPKQVVSVSGQHFPTFRPAYREIYYARHASGGGAIQDALTHGLNLVEWLIGPIERVSTDAAHQVLEGVEVEDTVCLIARLRGGVLASFALNQFQAPNEAFLFLHGTEGSIRVEPHMSRVGVYHRGGDAWKWHALAPADRDTAFILQAHGFLDALDGIPSALATLDEGWQTMNVNRAALESSREQNRPINISSP